MKKRRFWGPCGMSPACLRCSFTRHRWRRFDDGRLRYWRCAWCGCMVPRKLRWKGMEVVNAS